MNDKVNIAEKLAVVSEYFAPKIVAYLNDMKIQVVKISGDFVWHSHEETDEFFLVLDGRLTIQLEGRDIELATGDLFVVPRGVRHRPRADGEAHVLLIDPKDTPNTGDAGGPLTAANQEI
jgi:mannose-6-phosphate isomerase-like protein (cupin superfamily)